MAHLQPVEVVVVVGGEPDHAGVQVHDDAVGVPRRAAGPRVDVELSEAVSGGQLPLVVAERAAREVALTVRPVVPATGAGVALGLPGRVGGTGGTAAQRDMVQEL